MRLNFAIARGVLLLPARMIVNTVSVASYNNNLTKATDDMKLGVNNHVNLGTKSSSIKHMARGASSINPPNSHPSNPIHKKATEAQGIAKKKPTHTQTPAARKKQINQQHKHSHKHQLKMQQQHKHRHKRQIRIT